MDTDSDISRPDIGAELNVFRKKEILCDFTIHVRNNIFRCHLVVLSARSAFFLTFSKRSSAKELWLPAGENITPEVFEELLTYLYTGEITITDDNVTPLKKISSYLKIYAAVEMCDRYLSTKSPSIQIGTETSNDDIENTCDKEYGKNDLSMVPQANNTSPVHSMIKKTDEFAKDFRDHLKILEEITTNFNTFVLENYPKSESEADQVFTVFVCDTFGKKPFKRYFNMYTVSSKGLCTFKRTLNTTFSCLKHFLGKFKMADGFHYKCFFNEKTATLKFFKRDVNRSVQVQPNRFRSKCGNISTVCFEGKFYIYFTFNDTSKIEKDQLWVYDWSSNVICKAIDTKLMPVDDGTIHTGNGKLYLIGNDKDEFVIQSFKSVWQVWNLVGRIPGCITEYVSCLIGAKFYVHGTNRFLELDCKSAQWRELENREPHSLFVTLIPDGNILWLFLQSLNNWQCQYCGFDIDKDDWLTPVDMTFEWDGFDGFVLRDLFAAYTEY